MLELRGPIGKILNLIEEQIGRTPRRGRLVERLSQHLPGVPVDELHDRHAERLEVDKIVELKPKESPWVDAVLNQLIDDLR